MLLFQHSRRIFRVGRFGYNNKYKTYLEKSSQVYFVYVLKKRNFYYLYIQKKRKKNGRKIMIKVVNKSCTDGKNYVIIFYILGFFGSEPNADITVPLVPDEDVLLVG